VVGIRGKPGSEVDFKVAEGAVGKSFKSFKVSKFQPELPLLGAMIIERNLETCETLKPHFVLPASP
jgi:hypothetical protein